MNKKILTFVLLCFIIFFSSISAKGEGKTLDDYGLLNRAEKLYLYGKYDKAIPIYLNLLEKTENEIIKVRTLFKLGKAYYFLKDLRKSELYLSKVLKSDIKFIEITSGTRLFLSGIYETKGDYKKAIDILIPLGKKRNYYSFLANRKIERIISQHPNKGLEKNYKLIDFYIVQREYKKALEVIDSFLKDKKTIQLLYLKGKLLFNKRKYKEALFYFEEVLKGSNKTYKNNALYYKATILSYMNRLDEALEVFKGLPSSPAIELKIAYIYGRKGDTEKRLEIYKNFLKKFPLSYQVTYVIFQLANYYEKNKDSKKAIYYYNYLVNKYPNSRFADDAVYREIVLYKKLKEKEKIEELKKFLIKHHPTSLYTYYITNYKLNFTINTVISLESFIKDNKELEEKFSFLLKLFKNKMYEDVYYEAKRLYEKGERSLVLLYMLSISSEKIGRYYDSMKFRETIYYYLKETLGGISYDMVKFVYPKFYKPIVESEVKKYDIDPLLVYSIMREESRFGRYVLSSSYAIGLMQIIPSTGKWIASKLKVKEFDEIMLFNPFINIEFGVWYISYLYRLFSGNIDAILASYNGGPGNGKKWFKDIEGKDRIEIIENNISYAESKEYVKKCLSSYYTYKNIELYTNKNDSN